MDIIRTIKMNQELPSYRYEDLVEEYSNAVYKFCRSLTYSKEDAEDLFQETYLKAFEQMHKISISDNPQGFLFSTAIFIWKSWKRKYARRSRLAKTKLLEDADRNETCLEDSILVQEETRMVQNLVEGLPEKYRIPIILYYTVEMNVAEIAAALKLPAGTVKSRLFKARKLIEKGLVAIHYEEK